LSAVQCFAASEEVPEKAGVAAVVMPADSEVKLTSPRRNVKRLITILLINDYVSA
jgi:hypothetical protein